MTKTTNTPSDTSSCACTDCKCDPCTCGTGSNNTCCAKISECCSSRGKYHGGICGMIIRIVIVLGLIGGAFVLGMELGGGHSDRYDRDDMNYGGNRRGAMMNHMNIGASNQSPRNMGSMSGMSMMDHQMMGGSGTHDMTQMSMADMSKMLAGKTGDDLNRAFLEGMIPHHQAAVDMARALAGSNKPELVKLGGEIITAQTKEIEQMKAWQKAWGYTK